MPDRPAITAPLACQWTWYEYDEENNQDEDYSEQEVATLSHLPLVLKGEPIEIWLGRRGLPDQFRRPAFIIHRHGAASYVAGPGTGSVQGVDGDGSSGRLRFEGLAPDPQAARPRTISQADWVRPLGGDPAMAAVTGTLEWACEPPSPPSSPDPESCGLYPDSPFCLGDPDPIVLVVDSERQVGVNACGGLHGDTCGPAFYALPAENIVRVPPGGLLRFELPDVRSHFLRWSLSWAAQIDAERWQRLEESGDLAGGPAFEVIDEGGLSEGSVLEFAAPPTGDWSVRLGWTDDRDDEGGNMTSFFRVVVGD